MKRIRIGLRLMLLLVALFAALFAWVGAKREMQQVRDQAELDDLRHIREYSVINRNRFTNEQAWRKRMAEIDAAIADQKKRMD